MKNLYLIGNAHLDPVWLWRWQEGFSEILATFRSALDRMNEFPDFKFTSACAAYYEWVELADPEMFAEIKERVDEGRWGIVGGWYIQPDCNIPSGESFARHALISQRYFMSRFGKMAKTGYNVDSFGHNASLPQILRLSGMENYVFMRPDPHEKELSDNLFEWESADGSRVRTFRLPHCYNIGTRSLGLLDEIAKSTDTHPMMAFYGVGNHGGGPTIELITKIKERGRGNEVFSTPDEFFDSTRDLSIPTVRDELQHHARGCYSATSFIKKSNRKSEYELLAAESLCVMADRLTGENRYPAENLRRAWKNLLFDQFHDILGGCSIKSAYSDAANLFGETMAICEREINLAMTRILRRVDTLRGSTLPSAKREGSWRLWSHEKLGTPVAVFNPHAWEVDTTVELPAPLSRVTDETGADVANQRVRAEHTNGRDDKYGTAFRVSLPAFGYRIYRVFTESKPENTFDEIYVDEHTIDNGRVRVELDSLTGEVSRFFDKRAGRELISGRASTVLLDETNCDTWAHDKVSLGEPVAEFGEPEFSVVEQGCVRSTIRVTTRCEHSTIRRDYTLSADSDELSVHMVVDFREKHRTLKLSLPTDGETVSAAIPFGSFARPLGTGEEPCQSWLCCGSLGFASDSVYGYDTDGHNLRPTILRGAIYADHYAVRDEFCEYAEQGIGEFSYILFGAAPDSGSTASDAYRRSTLLNSKPRVLCDSFHGGDLGEVWSGCDIDADNLIVTAIKRAEDGSCDIVRCFEADGRDTDAALQLFGKRHELQVGHDQIVTVRSDGGRTNLIEQHKLP